FENSGAGPRDIVANDALGGNFLYNGSIELKVPLGLEQSSGISTAFFIDFGSLTEVDASGPEVRDEASLRMSAGFGVSWDSPSTAWRPMRSTGSWRRGCAGTAPESRASRVIGASGGLPGS
ncbi:MAG: BamA/TamA family outer membrane protein, partial [Holophagales bacterium]|nr:BamA/TamA family outer membrane protein [Holophagales bacterium]